MTSERSHEQSPPYSTLRRRLGQLLGMDLEQRQEIYLEVSASTNLRDGTYWLEILFSAGIATLGLILNSPAVIIGAMLISPLMGPILANGLALAAGDLALSLRALISLAISAMVAVSFATFLVVLLPFREMTSEIAARTQPNTLDLFIALFSGAVGSIAVCKKVRGVATSIPGVAIAVALMPPLCVVGYGAGLMITLDGLQGLDVVRGGALLFFTNLVAITFTAMVAFLLFQIDGPEGRALISGSPETRDARSNHFSLRFPAALQRIGSLPGRLILVTIFIALLFVPLSRSFDSLKHEIARKQGGNRIEQKATRLWQDSFARSAHGEVRSYIDTLSASQNGRELALQMRIFTSRPYAQEERHDFLNRLAAMLDRAPQNISFSLVEIPTSTYEVARRTPPEEDHHRSPPSTASIISEVRNRMSQSAATVRLPPPAILDGTELIVTSSGEQLLIDYVSPRDIDNDGKALLLERFRQTVDDPGLELSFRRIAGTVSISWEKRGAILTTEAIAELASVSALALRHPGWMLVIDAPLGDEMRTARVTSIQNQLMTHGIDESRLALAESPEGSDYEVSARPGSSD